MVQYAYRLLLDCVQTSLSHTYMSCTFLMMYATMWTLGIKFDTRFFALSACMLGYMRLSIIDFFSFAVRFLVYYFAAKKRIQVSMKDFRYRKYARCSHRVFCFLMKLNRIIGYYQHRCQNFHQVEILQFQRLTMRK